MAQSYALSAWFFTRALSAVYFVAFLSLAVQVSGLWGSKGILPIKGYLASIEKQVPTADRWQVPTVFWMDSADQPLKQAAWIGAASALLAFCGFAQGWVLLACFALYLSFVVAGQDFMAFQWDALLCEVGFLALFAVPWNFRFDFGVAVEPHWVVRYMFYIVLFKLMFLSGVVKLLSGDETWRDLSALSYHYWTQPLPNPLSPFVHALPSFVHQASTALTFVIELVLPFLMFWPRARVAVAAAFIALSLLIFTTGNYTFFNLLTIALCFWLIPDSWWELVTERLTVVPAPLFAPAVPSFVMAVLALVSLIWCTRWMYGDYLNGLVSPVLRVAQSLHVSSSYGLFANMTTSRPEIILEGSEGGRTWREYEFKYKAGGLYRRPPIVAPHQPRLDWQMWFAALGSFQQNYWLQNLLVRLFEASPEADSFFHHNPFAGAAPRYLRLRLYEYEFTSPAEILEDGKWWTRRLLREYSPVIENPFLNGR